MAMKRRLSEPLQHWNIWSFRAHLSNFTAT